MGTRSYFPIDGAKRSIRWEKIEGKIGKLDQ